MSSNRVAIKFLGLGKNRAVHSIFVFVETPQVYVDSRAHMKTIFQNISTIFQTLSVQIHYLPFLKVS